MTTLDTSSLIRFFTADEPAKAQKVKQLIEKEKRIFIPEVVFPELEYVLRGDYCASRQKVVGVFRFLLSRPNIKLSPVVYRAVEIFEETTLDIAGCLIAAHSLKGKLASFDRDLLKVNGVKNFWK